MKLSIVATTVALFAVFALQAESARVWQTPSLQLKFVKSDNGEQLFDMEVSSDMTVSSLTEEIAKKLKNQSSGRELLLLTENNVIMNGSRKLQQYRRITNDNPIIKVKYSSKEGTITTTEMFKDNVHLNFVTFSTEEQLFDAEVSQTIKVTALREFVAKKLNIKQADDVSLMTENNLAMVDLYTLDHYIIGDSIVKVYYPNH